MPTQPIRWPSKQLVWATVDALVDARLARGPQWRTAAIAAGRAVDAALAHVPPDLHVEARRDWGDWGDSGDWADAEVARRMRGVARGGSATSSCRNACAPPSFPCREVDERAGERRVRVAHEAGWLGEDGMSEEELRDHAGANSPGRLRPPAR